MQFSLSSVAITALAFALPSALAGSMEWSMDNGITLKLQEDNMLQHLDVDGKVVGETLLKSKEKMEELISLIGNEEPVKEILSHFDI